MFQSGLLQIIPHFLSLLALYTIITCVVQYWHFRKVPGPPLAAWTNLWLMWHMNNGELLQELKSRLHQTYGPTQRYGPNRIFFSQLEAVPIILSTLNPFPKASSYDPPKVFNHGSEVASLVSITDDRRAARIKRNLHSQFSLNGVLIYEKHVDHTVNELVNHLRAAGRTVDLKQWCDWFAFDAMARIAFSEDQGFMKQQKDVGGSAAAAKARFKHWSLYWAIPSLDAILYKNWFVRRSKRPLSGLTRIAIDSIERRRGKEGSETQGDDLLGLYMGSAKLDPELFTPSTTIGLTVSTISAGSETTAYTTAVTMYCLLENPRVLATLRAELESISATTESGWSLPPMAALRPLQYLEACVKEANRLHPVVATMPEREVPAGGATIAGLYVPAGTIVAVNTAGIYSNIEIFGNDIDVYRPERWLEVNDEQRTKMNRANLLFSAGKRMCLGLNVSWLEMRKVIPALVMNFDMSLAYPERGLKHVPGLFNEPGEIITHISPRHMA
ncbi:hypothetical protein HBI25_217660 [Parastagonospora nodorum]|nr:hypothetical protein HBH52_226740 [Parastagonospora nodorum]KAH4800490.1 hypothetical protein HBH61_211500 [Parastagonospora nodorum]KAH5090613.1 hypothetical protein HBH72_214890 [Parastagonospora nodorum]KAH5142515.1 hypothetical protein HBH69_198920 [Parastagonospora nodorum]KAH5411101.1 hypothetical protein HBI32_135430 [Parastagonospora nodorum]